MKKILLLGLMLLFLPIVFGNTYTKDCTNGCDGQTLSIRYTDNYELLINESTILKINPNYTSGNRTININKLSCDETFLLYPFSFYNGQKTNSIPLMSCKINLDETTLFNTTLYTNLLLINQTDFLETSLEWYYYDDHNWIELDNNIRVNSIPYENWAFVGYKPLAILNIQNFSISCPVSFNITTNMWSYYNNSNNMLLSFNQTNLNIYNQNLTIPIQIYGNNYSFIITNNHNITTINGYNNNFNFSLGFNNNFSNIIYTSSDFNFTFFNSFINNITNLIANNIENNISLYMNINTTFTNSFYNSINNSIWINSTSILYTDNTYNNTFLIDNSGIYYFNETSNIYTEIYNNFNNTFINNFFLNNQYYWNTTGIYYFENNVTIPFGFFLNNSVFVVSNDTIEYTLKNYNNYSLVCSPTYDISPSENSYSSFINLTCQYPQQVTDNNQVSDNGFTREQINNAGIIFVILLAAFIGFLIWRRIKEGKKRPNDTYNSIPEPEYKQPKGGIEFI